MSVRGAAETSRQYRSYSDEQGGDTVEIRDWAYASRDYFIGSATSSRDWDSLRAGGVEPRSADYALSASAGTVDADTYEFLTNPANKLRPAVEFSIWSGTVDIKIHKPGLSLKDFQDRLLRHEVYKETNAVQTSFYGIYNPSGQKGGEVGYLLTVTESMGKIYPTVTKITQWEERQDGHFTMGWEIASVDEAKAFLNDPANKARFKAVYDDAVKNGYVQNKNPKAAGYATAADFEAYSACVQGRLGIVSGATGQHEYDAKTGIYHYTQNIDFATPGMGAVINTFGAAKVIGAAMKVVYNSVFEPGIAGQRGACGATVSDQTNTAYTIQP